MGAFQRMRNSKAQQNATILRREMTDAERKLWQGLRQRQVEGHKFRRQYPIGPYVADFVCLSAGLVVEVDGGQHAERVEEDAARTRVLERAGFKVLRYWNDDVLLKTDTVLQAIWAELANRPHPNPPPQAGEGT